MPPRSNPRTEPKPIGAQFRRIHYRMLSPGSDFLTQSSNAQLLYIHLIGDEYMEKTGVLNWAPGRFAKKIPDLNAGDLTKALEELERDQYVIVDWDHNELLVRTYMKYDFHLSDKSRAIGVARRFPYITSEKILDAIAQQLARQRHESPEMPCWTVFQDHAPSMWADIEKYSGSNDDEAELPDWAQDDDGF